MHSCIYEGRVTHQRREPVDHRFGYRLFMIYLDLDEVPLLSEQGLLARSKFAANCYLRRDHLFDATQSLADEVRTLIADRTGCFPQGPIRLLTQLRQFGYYMSPLNLYYVFAADGEYVEFIVAEVNNTPWNERHCYVLWSGNQRDVANAGTLGFTHAKEFHVSPFMGMDLEYRWELSPPGEDLRVHLANIHGGRQLFQAELDLQRGALSRARLRRMAFRYPLMTARITAAIYYQACKLWWKQCPFYAHPQRQAKPANSAQETTTLSQR